MFEWFRCPDDKIIPYTDCLSKCRIDQRCLTLPTLSLISRQREWKGVASTTQLLDGTMYTFLKITQPYAIDPDQSMFALHGEGVHTLLKMSANGHGFPAEIPLSDDRDIFDLLEPDGNGYILTDYKTWGSFRVAKALGMVEVGKKPDPSGATYQRSGTWGKAGTPKMITVFQPIPSEVDNKEAELQLNNYRLMLEERGVPITRMQVQVLVRDGGLQVARGRGIKRNSYLIPINKMDDSLVRSYFTAKNYALMDALGDGKWSTPCTNDECWDGVRCRDYCEVAMYCPKGIIETGGK